MPLKFVNTAQAILKPIEGGAQVLKTVTPQIGTGNAYSAPAVIIDSPNRALNLIGFTVTSSGTFASGETVTTRITVYFSDGTSAYKEVSQTAAGTYTSTLADLIALAKDGVVVHRISVQAKTSANSTSVSISVVILCY